MNMSINSINFNEKFKASMDRALPDVSAESFENLLSLSSNKVASSTRFVFFRHGSSEDPKDKRAGGGDDNAELRDHQSIAQLKENGLPHFSAFFSSPAKAAVQTAGILAGNPDVNVNIDIRLRQKHWGNFHGCPITNKEYKQNRMDGEKAMDETATALGKLQFKFDGPCTAEESLYDVFERVIGFMRDCNETEGLKGHSICVVTHTPVLKAFFSSLVALEKNESLSYHKHDFENGGSVTVDVSSEGVISLNKISGCTFRAEPKKR